MAILNFKHTIDSSDQIYQKFENNKPKEHNKFKYFNVLNYFCFF